MSIRNPSLIVNVNRADRAKLSDVLVGDLVELKEPFDSPRGEVAQPAVYLACAPDHGGFTRFARLDTGSVYQFDDEAVFYVLPAGSFVTLQVPKRG